MEKIEDIGELLPYAKKHLFSQYKPNDDIGNCNDDHHEQISLKSLWKEPDWKELYANGYPKDLLATIFGYYHSLRLKPKTDNFFKQGGTTISATMWKDAYVISVNFIKEWCESAVSLESLNGLSDALKAHFNITESSKMDYQLYAAGRNTGKTWFHPLGKSGKYSQYKKLLPYLDWPNSVDAKKIKLFPTELIKNKTKESFYCLCEVNLKSYTWSSSAEEFSTYDDAVKSLITEHGDSFKLKESPTKDVYTPRKNVKDLVNAPRYFSYLDASSLMDDFGFRGIQFGNALSNIERQLFISNTYYSFQVIALILDIPHKWIGFGGLGLAFGARGSGSASAHYEPTLNIINLTRFNGAGSIAHEFAHCIDNRLAKKCGHPDKLYSEIDHKAENSDITERLKAFLNIMKACTKVSDYQSCAISLDRQKGKSHYWSMNCELVARAFEAYIQDMIEENNLACEWAVIGTKETDYKREMHPYPTGEERVLLNSVFKKELAILFGNKS